MTKSIAVARLLNEPHQFSIHNEDLYQRISATNSRPDINQSNEYSTLFETNKKGRRSFYRTNIKGDRNIIGYDAAVNLHEKTLRDRAQINKFSDENT